MQRFIFMMHDARANGYLNPLHYSHILFLLTLHRTKFVMRSSLLCLSSNDDNEMCAFVCVALDSVWLSLGENNNNNNHNSFVRWEHAPKQASECYPQALASLWNWNWNKICKNLCQSISQFTNCTNKWLRLIDVTDLIIVYNICTHSGSTGIWFGEQKMSKKAHHLIKLIEAFFSECSTSFNSEAQPSDTKFWPIQWNALEYIYRQFIITNAAKCVAIFAKLSSGLITGKNEALRVYLHTVEIAPKKLNSMNLKWHIPCLLTRGSES